ncbi:LLM class flavin-dependent oxidoreductase [Adhaeribacter aquaticus]|uniref:LLM class flavin-dependent oxidoreductase n=1 Tax=Adhaeribacter aquaticus TaxID=299567 RepID=UPI0004221C82|nr:LLM class flavin-dependent oxidoreductase [Adhaeribacter aquaticus]
MQTHKKLSDIDLSVLDLVTITAGGTPAKAMHNSLDLAQHTENWGYKRFWLAEHHNMKSIASTATAVLIGHIAGGTSKIRVGSGGIMLPNHAPLVVAEQFGTLESLYPGRIDLGLGRAPGTDQVTAMALRRHLNGSVDDFPNNVMELQNYFAPADPKARVRAIPGEGLQIPIWLLGSSTFSAQLAGMLGLPFAFASHFAPALLDSALKIYRDSFRPSESLSEPKALACVNVVAADTDEEANRLATSLYLFALGVVRGNTMPLQAPVDDVDLYWDGNERYAVEQMFRYAFVGGPQTIENELQKFLDQTQVDEIMVVSHIYDHAARLRSYEILSRLQQEQQVKASLANL